MRGGFGAHGGRSARAACHAPVGPQPEGAKLAKPAVEGSKYGCIGSIAAGAYASCIRPGKSGASAGAMPVS